MDAALLSNTKCWFGGGTAVVLLNGEYRLSRDLDFLCADRDGYRELRTAVVCRGASALFGPEVGTIREFRADAYGLRAVLSLHGQPIKFEIVREGRIDLNGTTSRWGVPILSRTDMIAEKLLANADRCLDRAVAYRDAIDLGFLVRGGDGRFPDDAVRKAEAAYGAEIRRKVTQVLSLLDGVDARRHAAQVLDMSTDDVVTATDALRGAACATWPETA